jgi:3',5'-cyclic-AMP phosphodiesterase
MSDHIVHDPSNDGVDRRGFLKCMAWAGTGLVWAVSGGIPGCTRVEPQAEKSDNPSDKASGNASDKEAAPRPTASFTFAQVSDSHLGFSREPNRDVAETYRLAIARINALEPRPAFVLHTGDLTHLARPDEFDAVDQLHRTIRAGEVICVPGEHDVTENDCRAYMERYGRGATGNGWRSFDHQGVHFVGLNNCMNLRAGSLGLLGEDQLDWLRRDLAGKSDSTPIVVFAHIPLWTVHQPWGWGTQDSARALELLRRFGSVTVLNGHIHQIMQRVEGNITFHAARSTAFPQGVPGVATAPGPRRDVAAGQLRSLIGVTRVNYVEHNSTLAITDDTLGGQSGAVLPSSRSDPWA